MGRQPADRAAYFIFPLGGRLAGPVPSLWQVGGRSIGSGRRHLGPVPSPLWSVTLSVPLSCSVSRRQTKVAAWPPLCFL